MHFPQLSIRGSRFPSLSGAVAEGTHAFVWWGVPRSVLPLLQIRVLAFVIAALGAWSMVDAGWTGPGVDGSKREDGSPMSVVQRQLRIDVRAALSPTHFVVSLYAVTRRPQGDRTFVPERRVEQTWGQTAVVQLASGTHLVVVEATGAARWVGEVELYDDTRLDVQLTPSAPRTITVVAGSDDALRPLPGATVLLSDPEPGTTKDARLPFGAATDPRGRAHFASTPQGPLLVRIFAPGFQPYRTVAEGDLTVRLESTTSLQITVVQDGKPQAEAEVVLSGPLLWPSQAVLTKADGSVSVTGLATGRYSVFARKGAAISRLDEEVIVDDKMGINRLRLELAPGEFVSARIVSQGERRPVADAKVTVTTSAFGSVVLHGRTGADGRVRIGPLLEPRGMIQARATGYVGATRSFPDLEPDDPGAAPMDLLLELERAATITGRVVDERGFPVALASVEAVGTGRDNVPYSVTYNSGAVTDAHFTWAEDWGAHLGRALVPAGELGVMLGPVPPIPLGDVPTTSGMQNLTTDERGYFTISDVPPGHGVVLARHPDYLDGKSESLELEPGGERNVTVVLRGGAPLFGRLLDHRGFPVSGAMISASSRGFERRVMSESDGNFSFGAAPQDLSLRIHASDNPLVVLLALEVDPKKRDDKLLIELPPPRGDAEIKVTDVQGEPVGLAQVTFTSLDRSVPFRQTRFTQDDGVARVPAVEGLEVRIDVSATGFLTKTWDARARAQMQVDVTRSLHASGLVTAVRGRKEAAGAHVEFEAGALRRTTSADELGRYQLTGLPAGRGRIRATHPELGRASMDVTVEPGVGDRPFELPTLDLNPSLHVEGRVEDGRGQVVPGALVSAARISAFLGSRTAREVLAMADEAGQFSVDVERSQPLYLYGAAPARSFGFSERIEALERDVVRDVVIVLDRSDEAFSHDPATVLVSLEERGSQIVIYAVAAGSQAERAGLRAEDQISSIMEQRPVDLRGARQLLSGTLGGPLRVEVLRGAQHMIFLVEREGFVR